MARGQCTRRCGMGDRKDTSARPKPAPAPHAPDALSASERKRRAAREPRRGGRPLRRDETALERRLVDEHAVQRPDVFAVVAPLGGLEAAAIRVLLDRLEATALGLRQRAPPAIARRLELDAARLAQRLAHP